MVNTSSQEEQRRALARLYVSLFDPFQNKGVPECRGERRLGRLVVRCEGLSRARLTLACDQAELSREPCRRVLRRAATVSGIRDQGADLNSAQTRQLS